MPDRRPWRAPSNDPVEAEVQIQTYDQLAREITAVAIERGHCSDGHPAEKVGDYYRSVAATLYELDMEQGSEAMNAAAQFVVAAISAGLVYAGTETIDFLTQVAARVRAANREIGAGSGRF